MSGNGALFELVESPSWITPTSTIIGLVSAWPLYFHLYNGHFTTAVVNDICHKLVVVLLLSLVAALGLHELLHYLFLKLCFSVWRRVEPQFRPLPIHMKATVWWLPGIPTRVYTDTLMPTGILLTSVVVLPALVLAGASAVCLSLIGLSWYLWTIAIGLQIGFGLNDFRLSLFTVVPKHWLLDNGGGFFQFHERGYSRRPLQLPVA